MKKKILSMVLALIMVFTMLLQTSCSSNSRSPENRFFKAIDNGDYQEAKEIYKEDIRGNFNLENAVYTGLIERLNAAYNDYNDGKITFDEAMVVVGRIEKSNVFDETELKQAIYDLEILKTSKDSYDYAESMMKEKIIQKQ